MRYHMLFWKNNTPYNIQILKCDLLSFSWGHARQESHFRVLLTFATLGLEVVLFSEGSSLASVILQHSLCNTSVQPPCGPFLLGHSKWKILATTDQIILNF